MTVGQLNQRLLSILRSVYERPHAEFAPRAYRNSHQHLARATSQRQQERSKQEHVSKRDEFDVIDDKSRELTTIFTPASSTNKNKASANM